VNTVQWKSGLLRWRRRKTDFLETEDQKTRRSYKKVFNFYLIVSNFKDIKIMLDTFCFFFSVWVKITSVRKMSAEKHWNILRRKVSERGQKISVSAKVIFTWRKVWEENALEKCPFLLLFWTRKKVRNKKNIFTINNLKNLSRATASNMAHSDHIFDI